MRILLKTPVGSLLLLLTAWGILTLWAEAEGPARNVELGDSTSERSALVVYDPDPICNLDERVCEASGKALAEAGCGSGSPQWRRLSQRQLPVIRLSGITKCTYSVPTPTTGGPTGRPASYIKNAPIELKPVVAITLGSGSTQAAQRALEKLIANQGEWSTFVRNVLSRGKNLDNQRVTHHSK